jgi:hypothetical protein
MFGEHDHPNAALRSLRSRHPTPFGLEPVDVMGAVTTVRREPEVHMMRRARLLRWPSDGDERGMVLAERQPCVWLVESGAAPPEDWADWEDWARLPVDDDEIAARVAGVEHRGRALATSAWLDDFDVLHRGDVWVALSPLETRLMRELLIHEGAVVRRKVLIDAAWPAADDAHSKDLNTPMKLLKRKAKSVQVTIHTIAGRGYLAEVTAGEAKSASV